MKNNIDDPKEKGMLNTDESNKPINSETTERSASLKKGDSMDVITDSEKNLTKLDDKIGEEDVTNVPDQDEVN